VGCGRLHFAELPLADGASDAARTDAPSGPDTGSRDAGTDGRLDAAPRDAALDGGMDAGRDAGLADAGRDAGPAAITVSGLLAEWTTANTIRWRWTLVGEAASFATMELVVGRTEADVVGRVGTARVIGAADNPELGVFTLPLTGGTDPSNVTTTDGLGPATDYFGQLTAIDRAGLRSATNVAPATTTSDPTREVVLFRDAATAGYSQPAEVVYSASGAYMGTHCYEYRHPCGPGMASCFENLRRSDIAVDASAVSASAFPTAFLEWAMLVDDPTRHSYYSLVRLWMTGGGATDLYALEHFTIRADRRYRVYQIPLRVMTNGSAPLSRADLARPIAELGFGGSWPSSAIVRFDEVRIRW